MNWRARYFVFSGVLIVAVLGGALVYLRWTAQLPGVVVEALLHRIHLPPGFVIRVYATGVPNARSLALGDDGTVFVGSRRAGKVYALVSGNDREKAGEVLVIARGLMAPDGVAFRDGSLYVSDVYRILRYDRIEANLRHPPSPVVMSTAFPGDANHGWKFIRFGPDGWLYVPVGMPCNICKPADERYGTITRMRPDGSGFEIFARGLRNSVGFDWSPQTNELWFTDNGRDSLGDDLPPDELNHAPRAGMNFGFPYCHGKNISDPQFGREHACSEFTAPALELPAHVAPLGMRFYTGSMFPASYRNQIFIAEHGSSDRASLSGYRISLADLQDSEAVGYRVFASGWQMGRLKWGRPVDVQVMPDGALLVSDDYAGAVYRITYEK